MKQIQRILSTLLTLLTVANAYALEPLKESKHAFMESHAKRVIARFDTNPEDKEERYREMSLVSYLTQNSPALLLIQGDKDTTIPVKQAHRMQEALKTIEADPMENNNHKEKRPETVKQFTQMIAEWQKTLPEKSSPDLFSNERIKRAQ